MSASCTLGSRPTSAQCWPLLALWLDTAQPLSELKCCRALQSTVQRYPSDSPRKQPGCSCARTEVKLFNLSGFMQCLCPPAPTCGVLGHKTTLGFQGLVAQTEYSGNTRGLGPFWSGSRQLCPHSTGIESSSGCYAQRQFLLLMDNPQTNYTASSEVLTANGY